MTCTQSFQLESPSSDELHAASAEEDPSERAMAPASAPAMAPDNGGHHVHPAHLHQVQCSVAVAKLHQPKQAACATSSSWVEVQSLAPPGGSRRSSRSLARSERGIARGRSAQTLDRGRWPRPRTRMQLECKNVCMRPTQDSCISPK